MDVERTALAPIGFSPWRRDLGPCEAAVPARRHIAFLIADLNVGGVQRTTLTLAGAMAARGYRVDLVVLWPGGTLFDQVPPGVNVVQLARSTRPIGRICALLADTAALPEMLRPVLFAHKPSPTLPFLPAIARYLREQRPEALVGTTWHLNIEAIWARRLARVPTRVLISERTAPTPKMAKSKNWRQRFLPPLMRRTYPMADVIVAVSDALGDDLARLSGLPRGLIRTICDPVVDADLLRQASAPVRHPWLASAEVPVILGVGRLTEQKDFPTLLRAFARVRQQRAARLIILGGSNKREEKGSERMGALCGLATTLGVRDDVDLPGFVSNPFAFMSRAAVFVLSSRWEGLPGVLIQALACGCPVVSTDCPTGPAEILDAGRYGALVPMGDDVAMASAIEQTLAAPLPADLLRSRAADFSVDQAVDSYLEALFGAGFTSPAYTTRPYEPTQHDALLGRQPV